MCLNNLNAKGPFIRPGEIERYWENIINTMNDGLILVRKDGIISMVNQPLERFGLCVHFYAQIGILLELHQENLLAMYRGKLAEQFVAQELMAWHSPELFYWARDARGSNAEVDYLVVREGRIYPVEVKSGAGGSLRSLHLMLENYPNCPQGLVLYTGPYKTLPGQKLVFLPLYNTATIADQRLQAWTSS